MTVRSRCLPLRTHVRVACLVLSLAAVMVAAPAWAVTITIQNTDAPGKGFNDTSPRAPVGGNPGKTLGAQRLNLFQRAAEIWGQRLGGNVPILVSAGFSAQGGNSVSAILGYARPTTVHSDFQGAPTPHIWYVASLTNELRGVDQNDLLPDSCPIQRVGTHCPEIEANFNSDVDGPVVFGAAGFYYGFDGNAGNNLDFLSVLLHEMGHGLGVLSLIGENGDRLNGISDAFTDELEDATLAAKRLSLMTDSQRRLAIRDNGDLVFTGANARAAAVSLAAIGKRSDGALKIYAPAIYDQGASASHVDTTASPDELMEPFLNTPAPRNLDLTVAMLKDLGWTTLSQQKCGDANNDKKITTADALVVLRTAVGISSCPGSVCNVNGIGGVTTGDALLVLKVAVGQDVVLKCPLA